MFVGCVSFWIPGLMHLTFFLKSVSRNWNGKRKQAGESGGKSGKKKNNNIHVATDEVALEDDSSHQAVNDGSTGGPETSTNLGYGSHAHDFSLGENPPNKSIFWPDFFAGLSLCAVGCSSPLCDAFLVYAGKFPHDPATGKLFFPSDEIRSSLVKANDIANSASRLGDRSTCIFVFFLALVNFRFIHEYPEIFDIKRLGVKNWLKVNWRNHTFPLVLWFLVAVIVSQCGQYLRKKNPCEIDSSTYITFSYFHTAWHALLVLGFLFNCCDRKPEDQKNK